MSSVLIVEDSATQARRMAILLGEVELTSEIVSDAESAFARLQTERFVLVVADVNLPGESGFDLCRRIKDDPALRDTPVLVVTADSDPANVLRGLAAGADAFMTKDHPPGEIVRRVERTIQGGATMVRQGERVYSHVVFRGNEFLVAANRERLLNILLAAFEDVVDLNERLRASETALRELNREIRKTNKALEEANQLKDRFLGIAAHDLRNPLNAIQGLASILIEGDEGPVSAEQADMLRRIVRQTNSMLVLLRDLLDVAALRAGKLEVRASSQDPRGLLLEAFERFILPARQKGVNLVSQVPDRLPNVAIDFDRMLDVVSNLISNGVKYCRPGDQVTLRATAADRTLEIAVEDTGPGIRTEELPRLFQPFSKVSSVPTGGEQATGLGLSIVREIVDLHGGTIDVESEFGKGSTFRVLLPIVEEQRAAST